MRLAYAQPGHACDGAFFRRSRGYACGYPFPLWQSLEQGLGIGVAEKFCKSFNFELQAAANEDSIVISLGSVHSFPLDEVYRYLQTATVRDTLIQAMLDAPMFEVRWRWNAAVLWLFNAIGR